MRGKYSPTVFHSYTSDSKWFIKNGGGYDNGKNPDSEFNVCNPLQFENSLKIAHSDF